jgi:hypothetical protein
MLGNLEGCVAPPESQFKLMLYEAQARGEALDRYLEYEIDRGHRLHSWGLTRPSLLRVRSNNFVDCMSDLVRLYASQHYIDGRVWIDHTPNNLRYAAMWVDAKPDIQFVHIIRDGRANAASVLPLDWGPNDIIRAAKWWTRKTSEGLEAARLWPQRVRLVRYEELVADPLGTCSALCQWLGLPFDADRLFLNQAAVPHSTRDQHRLVGTPPDITRINAWKSQLSADAVACFEWYAGELLQRLGYELHGPRPPKRPSLYDQYRYGSYRDWTYLTLYNLWRRHKRRRLDQPDS